MCGEQGMKDLFGKKLSVVNIGLESFKQTLDSVGVESVHIDWKPPILVDN